MNLLTNTKIQTLHSVLCRLEPLDKPAFHFADIQVRYNLIRNIKLLGKVLEEVEELRVKLVKELLPPGEAELTGERLAEFRRLYAALLAQTNDVPLHTVTLEGLELAKNDIHSVLVAELLGTVITE
jgi:hypothetical protein